MVPYSSSVQGFQVLAAPSAAGCEGAPAAPLRHELQGPSASEMFMGHGSKDRPGVVRAWAGDYHANLPRSMDVHVGWLCRARSSMIAFVASEECVEFMGG